MRRNKKATDLFDTTMGASGDGLMRQIPRPDAGMRHRARLGLMRRAIRDCFDERAALRRYVEDCSILGLGGPEDARADRDSLRGEASVSR